MFIKGTHSLVGSEDLPTSDEGEIYPICKGHGVLIKRFAVCRTLVSALRRKQVLVPYGVPIKV